MKQAIPPWLLIMIGVLCGIAAVAVAIWPQTPSAPSVPTTGMTDPEAQSAAATGACCGQGCAGHGAASDHPILAGLHALPPISTTAVQAAADTAADRLSFAAATGRPDALLLPHPGAAAPDDATSEPGPTLRLPAIPRQGQAAILIRSTLGGIEAQRHVTARWHCSSPAAVTFRQVAGLSPDYQVAVHLERGIWTCQDPDLAPVASSALVDLARVIAAAQTAWATEQTLTPGAQFPLAGASVTVWSVTERQVLLVGGDDSAALNAYPPQPGAWDDWRLHLHPDGTWQALERLVASPATPETPGFLVRRVVVEWL